MRQILFRGKRMDNDEFAYGDLLHLPNGDVVILSDKGYAKIKPKTVGQYTGLTDKNGKRIFEGDILRYTWDTLGGEKKPYTYVISYNDKEARFIGECDSDDLQLLLPSFKYVRGRGEVIGNIYGNPELLEEL